ncbi:HECT-like ubiquitin-conjugating enzyme-binding-domain-containing protein [Melanogaster broomeanus]|nr:HECT-like ubiquitin-conjugating enzyme-binding-domain-containing protein [Melanogaster broomeanus]
MATLVRTRPTEQHAYQQTSGNDLQTNIPTPFPSEHLVSLQDNDSDILDELAAERVDYEVLELEDASEALNDIRSSIAMVQHSCLMTLTTLLRLSESSSPTTEGDELGLEQMLAETPLACLVHTLRTRDGHHELSRDREALRQVDEAALLSELHELVDALAPSLDRRDAHLAQAIIALLLDLDQLPASIASNAAEVISQAGSSAQAEDRCRSSLKSPFSLLNTLQRQLSSLQPSTRTGSSSGSRPTPVETVETAMLWARIDEELETVVSLCKQRASSSSTSQSSMTHSTTHRPEWHVPTTGNGQVDDVRAPSFDDHLPPEYDSEYPYPDELPPSYVAEAFARASLEETLSRGQVPAPLYPPEKVSKNPSASTTALDLDLITRAIDRLYVAAPQLVDQRVELRREKIVQMEKARVVDPELDKMLDLIDRASAREIPDQSVVIDPRRRTWGRGKVDLVKQRSIYIEHLVQRSSAGRLHAQDAVLTSSRSASVPVASSTPSTSNAGDADRNLDVDRSSDMESEGGNSGEIDQSSFQANSQSGFVPAPEAPVAQKIASGTASSTKDGGTGSATRTSSSDTKSASSSSMPSKASKRFSDKFSSASKSRPASSSGEGVSNGALDITYVAEHHETLKHVLLFIVLASPSDSLPVGTLSAEVLPSTSSGTFGDWLLLRLAGTPSPPLALPVPVVPGVKEILSRSGHWEVKASCSQLGTPPNEIEDPPLLTASELTSLSPVSYTCSSCSLPLVPTPPNQYRDLPSEHWEELVDAWMCHPEGQTLAKSGMTGGGDKGAGFGFWPAHNEALVGGSYVLFDGESVAAGNIKDVVSRERGDSTYLQRCICGAILGRRQDRKRDDGSTVRMYRLFKVPKIPMSAFVLQDMIEHVQSHATYRFVLSDEEEEKPRLLIWLFKPKIRISYMLSTPYLLPKSDAADASKVLYKILGPTSTTIDLKDLLNKYPGFPQAEHLFYPMDVCRQLAALLKESTASYPESIRTMTGLDVGWLRRT